MFSCACTVFAKPKDVLKRELHERARTKMIAENHFGISTILYLHNDEHKLREWIPNICPCLRQYVQMDLHRFRHRGHTHTQPASDEKEIINFSANFRVKWILFAIRVWIECTTLRRASIRCTVNDRVSFFLRSFRLQLHFKLSIRMMVDFNFVARLFYSVFGSVSLFFSPRLSTTAWNGQNEKGREENVIWF